MTSRFYQPTCNDEGEKPCLLSTDAVVMAEQMGIRTRTTVQQEYLADLMTATRFTVRTFTVKTVALSCTSRAKL